MGAGARWALGVLPRVGAVGEDGSPMGHAPGTARCSVPAPGVVVVRSARGAGSGPRRPARCVGAAGRSDAAPAVGLPGDRRKPSHSIVDDRPPAPRTRADHGLRQTQDGSRLPTAVVLVHRRRRVGLHSTYESPTMACAARRGSLAYVDAMDVGYAKARRARSSCTRERVSCAAEAEQSDVQGIRNAALALAERYEQTATARLSA